MKETKAPHRITKPFETRHVQCFVILLPWLYISIDLFYHMREVRLNSPTLALSSNITTEGDGTLLAIVKRAGEEPLLFNETFEYALSQSETDKRDHHYEHMYGPIFNQLKHKQISFLEIGLHHGASLMLWKSFFSSAKIYGIDKAPPISNETIYRSLNATIFLGDQENIAFLEEVKKTIFSEVGYLDFIIDDGGHTMNQQITSFTYLMPLVKPGGYYFIEDLETSYYGECRGQCYVPCCGGGPVGMKGTAIDMIKSFIDVLNEDYIVSGAPMKSVGIGNYSVNPSDHLISGVHCRRNICSFKRKLQDSYF